MLITPIEVSQTASSGAWSFNTQKFSGAMLYQVVLKAATSTTTFDVTITDEKDNVVYDSLIRQTTATGTFEHELSIPLRGIYTIAVANSSADEAFTGRLLVGD